MRQGYLKRTTRGRCLTAKAYEILDMKDRYADQGFLL